MDQQRDRHEENVGSTAANDESNLQCKQSLDEDIRSMLSVTPVNVPPVPTSSGSNAELPSHTSTGSTDNDPASNEDAFSSSSASSGSDEDTEESEESEDSGIEADEQEDDEVQMRESNAPHQHAFAPTPPQSEWDRALMTGKPSKGRASDFFVPTQPILSSDSSEFYSTVQAARATTPGILSPTHDAVNQQQKQLQQQQQQHLQLQPPRPNSRNQTSSYVETTSKSQTSQADGVVARKRSDSNSSVPTTTASRPHDYYPTATPSTEEDLSAGVLPDVLMTMRQRIESINMFDSDLLRLTNDYVVNDNEDPLFLESRESLKRSSQQSISAAVLVSLAHKRYERRRLAAMEIEKVVRSLVVLQHQSKPAKNELDRVRAILLLLSDDYVRSTNEDARKGGVVALAACAIGLKKANDQNPIVQECRDLILASVVHACQDHSQRVRYYATESLFNVVKVIPSLVVQHFFILFEVLRSLFADVDPDVRSGAELLDKKLKEVIVGAMNAGIFTAEQCVPVFARFVYMRNKATKRLTLTWLQELNEKLIGAPILEFLHLFLGGVIEMVADPSIAIRQSALAFLQSMLPKLLVNNSDVIDNIDDDGMVPDFDKILQSLVSTMEHPNPFVRKVAMYWMSRIIKAHMSIESGPSSSKMTNPDGSPARSAAISVRNAVSHVLPGILLSVGDNFVSTATTKDAFLPDQTTRSLAEQTNACLQDAVRRDGEAYVEHLDSFIVALRDEMANPGGSSSKNPPAIERTPYRMDVLQDGTGIETAGWFRTSGDPNDQNNENMVMSRLCALHWVIVLYESVVPDPLKADYAREFVNALIQQLIDRPPETIILKTLEVLARITVPVDGEEFDPLQASYIHASTTGSQLEFPMDHESVNFATRDVNGKSRDREVFATLIQLHAENEWLLEDLSSIMTYMCKLQPPEFVMISFAVELHRFIQCKEKFSREGAAPRPSDLKFVSAFIQNMNHVIFNTEEARPLREALKDCISTKADTVRYHQRSRLFHILHYSFSHNIAATVTLCLWVGAFRTAHIIINTIDPLDINLPFLLEVDRLIEMLERPLFRHLHVRMLERDRKQSDEGSGTMLFQLLKSILMILPQSTCYRVLRDRLVSVSYFRQSTMIRTASKSKGESTKFPSSTMQFVGRTRYIRNLHCRATWQAIRQDSLETKKLAAESADTDGSDRRSWLGYASKEEQVATERAFRDEKKYSGRIEDISPGYHDIASSGNHQKVNNFIVPIENKSGTGVADEVHTADDDDDDNNQWKNFWATADT